MKNAINKLTEEEFLVKLSDEDRIQFWKRIKKGEENECWEWIGLKDSAGYGIFQAFRYNKRAHRIALSITSGQSKRERFCCHSCDNPPCCNPKHLFWGTPRENTQDSIRKGRFFGFPKTMNRQMHSGEKHWSKRHPEKYQRGDMHWSRRNPEKIARGENAGSKLKTADVVQIRKLISDGKRIVEIAALFKISVPTIKQIRRRKTWTHI